MRGVIMFVMLVVAFALAGCAKKVDVYDNADIYPYVKSDPVIEEPVKVEKEEKIIDWRPEDYDIYTVGTWEKDRACLWNIAGNYYGDHYEWFSIYMANKYDIEDPDLIYPGQELVLPLD